MITTSRRQLLATTGLLALGGAIPAGCSRAAGEALAVGKPNLFIGTGGHGHTYPGASLPFGMAQLSPDTNTHGWDACSGYHQKDGSIMGFSHTHHEYNRYANILFMPVVGPIKTKPGSRENPDALHT